MVMLITLLLLDILLLILNQNILKRTSMKVIKIKEEIRFYDSIIIAEGILFVLCFVVMSMAFLIRSIFLLYFSILMYFLLFIILILIPISIFKRVKRIIKKADELYKDKKKCKEIYEKNICSVSYRLKEKLEESNDFVMNLNEKRKVIEISTFNDLFQVNNVYGHYSEYWVALCSLANVNYKKAIELRKGNFSEMNSPLNAYKQAVRESEKDINNFINKLKNK